MKNIYHRLGQFGVAFLIFLIRTYKKLISPLLPHSCRYLPTCSEYFVESLRKKGFFSGFFHGVRRILKCHPFGDFGYDPVPD